MDDPTGFDDLARVGDPSNATTLQRFKIELDQLNADCHVIQDGLSDLLVVTPPVGLPTEMHLLQVIDRMEQTLCDLAAFIDRLDSSTEEHALQHKDLADALKLASLKARLFPSGQTHNNANKSGEVDLF
ncbi:hypothetical protein [uncultured Aliiroseovarius sp.]|uniref:hypothetical protein n=1 Tax=uncultured Aliiroseovarius sp. TaxID=1658783 RepID=UPI00260B43A3|nr:hypothetical protein [uncultured Aliiroseovarius sp.]